MTTPATMAAIIATIFEALDEDAGEREGNRLVIPSGYGEGAVVINAQDIAVALLERFDITDREAPADGN
jgi:hypothetical protein